MDEKKVYVLRIEESTSENLVPRVIGAYSNKSKVWKAVEKFYLDYEMVYDCMDKYPDQVWSYSTLTRSFKEYSHCIVKMVGDENTKYYDHNIQLHIQECIIDQEV